LQAGSGFAYRLAHLTISRSAAILGLALVLYIA